MQYDETDLQTVLTSLSLLDDKVEEIAQTLARFAIVLDRFQPLLEKYETGGPVGMLFGGNGKRKETQWPSQR